MESQRRQSPEHLLGCCANLKTRKTLFKRLNSNGKLLHGPKKVRPLRNSRQIGTKSKLDPKLSKLVRNRTEVGLRTSVQHGICHRDALFTGPIATATGRSLLPKGYIPKGLMCTAQKGLTVVALTTQICELHTLGRGGKEERKASAGTLFPAGGAAGLI